MVSTPSDKDGKSGGGEKRDRGTEGCREKERERDQFPHGNKLKMFLMPFSVFPLPKN